MTIELPLEVLCAYLVLGEHISLSQIVGIIVMLAAISVMNYHKSLKAKK